MSFHVVIPARLGSTRLPRKVLLDLGGQPVVQWAWQAAMAAGAVSVTIATDAEEVAAVCRGFGAEVAMTDAAHQSGTDRANEVARQRGWAADTLIVNVQGDEPLMPPALIAQVAALLADDAEAHLATLAHAIHDDADFANPNVVKVVSDRRGYALYFSRAPIPWQRDGSTAAAPKLPQGLAHRHIGLYAYRAAALAEFSALPPAALETCEALEQLRALAHGFRIKLGFTETPPPRGVDTQQDLDALAQHFAAR
ncbi:MAG: 3-deoxy-manno-octulosonate cytidylyltransferase [Pseudomonadota bacterium]